MPYFEILTIELGPITIQFWGLMVALGFMAGIGLLIYQTKKLGLPPNKVLDLGLLMVVSGLIGARLLYVINEWSLFSNDPGQIIRIWQGGLSWYGGLIAAVAVGWWYARRHKLLFWQLTDKAIMSLALGEMIGRIGCLGIHDHLGKPTTVAWGITVDGVTRHETALYSIIGTFVIFIILILISHTTWGGRTGSLTALYLLLYGILSFSIYQYRAIDLPGSDPVWGAIRPSQIFSVMAVLTGVWLIYAKPFISNQKNKLT